MTDSEIIENIEIAIDKLKAEKRPLLPGVSERSFAHRIAVHMENLFEGWDIDCEYNRRGLLTKELEGIKQCDEQRRTERIYPDIIVHYRTNEREVAEEENLLVIEMKHDDPNDICDKKKLELMTDSREKYKYQLGLYINVTRKGDFNKTWYKDGKAVSEKEIS
jgi:hypothetical protein